MTAAGKGSHMLAEMRAQPAVLLGLVEHRRELLATVRSVAPQGLRAIMLVARGSSDNAAVYGRYVLEAAARVPVALAAPSLQTRYGIVPRLDDALVVAISQSGETPEIVTTLERLAGSGARTLAVTNEAGSPLAEAADATLPLGAGTEQAVPATKTFTAQTAAMCLIAEALGTVPGMPADPIAGWRAAIDAVETVLADPDGIVDTARALPQASHVLPIARGFLYAAALEVGLKLAETTGIAVHGTSTADLQHGPIATVHAATLALCFATEGPVAADVAEVAAQLVERGATVAAVIADPQLIPSAELIVPVPAGVPEPLAILPQVVRGQQLARMTALSLDIDPDAPFALRKVTPTT